MHIGVGKVIEILDVHDTRRIGLVCKRLYWKAHARSLGHAACHVVQPKARRPESVKPRVLVMDRLDQSAAIKPLGLAAVGMALA